MRRALIGSTLLHVLAGLLLAASLRPPGEWTLTSGGHARAGHMDGHARVVGVELIGGPAVTPSLSTTPGFAGATPMPADRELTGKAPAAGVLAIPEPRRTFEVVTVAPAEAGKEESALGRSVEVREPAAGGANAFPAGDAAEAATQFVDEAGPRRQGEKGSMMGTAATSSGGAPEAAGMSGAEIAAGETGESGAATAEGAGRSFAGASDIIPPEPLHIAIPVVPSSRRLQSSREEATAQLLVHVTTEGEVDAAKILKSTGTALFDKAAVETAYRLRYRPGSRGGVPAAMWAQAEISF